MLKRIVITGIGIASPLGIGVKTFWENLLAGRMGIRRISAFDPSGFPCQIAGEVPAYKIGEYVPKHYRKATKVMARDIELAIIAADDAFKDAGIQSKAYTDTPGLQSDRFGCNIGSGLINADLAELANAMYPDREGSKLDLAKWGPGMSKLTPLWMLKYLPNMPACHVTIIHQLKGPSNTITCAEASSHLAIGEAFRTLQRGKADLAVCGGAESKVSHMALMRQCLLKRVNEESNDDPAGAVRPFDSAAKGSVPGEGGGLLILEEYEHAKNRGAKIYAEVVGFGASQDAYRVTDPEPSGHSYGMAIKKALAEANVAPEDVGCLVPHGTGLAGHDSAELNGLAMAFGDAAASVPISPIKAQIGNLAAGCGVDAAAAVLAVHHGKIPPALNTRAVRDGRKLNVSNEARDGEFDISVSSVYSLGGQNAALVFKRVQ